MVGRFPAMATATTATTAVAGVVMAAAPVPGATALAPRTVKVDLLEEETVGRHPAMAIAAMVAAMVVVMAPRQALVTARAQVAVEVRVGLRVVRVQRRCAWKSMRTTLRQSSESA